MRHRFAHLFAYLFDRLLASDPSLDRARSSLRALLTAAACAGVFLLLTRLAGLDYQLALPGIVVPMMAGVALQDPGRRQQQVTMAWVPVVASVALVLASLVADNLLLSGGVFLLTIFGAFQMRRFGPRGSGLGAIAYQSVFYGMLFKTPPDKAQWLPPFVFVGCAIAWTMQFWIVPQHPGRMVVDELRAFHARVRTLLDDLARLVEAPGARTSRRIAPQLASLTTQSLALDARLAGFTAPSGQDAGLRDAVLRCELAAGAIATVAQEAAGNAQADRRALAQRLRALRADDTAASTAIPGLPDLPRWRLDWAARTLAHSAPWRQGAPAMHDEKNRSAPHPDKPAGGSPLDDANGRRRFDDTTRRASQATAAALGALAAGYAISPTHWYWAVFTALVVFTRSVTVGQTVSGAWRQVLAAAGGVCFGMLVAELAHGHKALELGLLFAFVAIAFYAYKGLQNLYVVVLTAMLAMVYELLGKDSVGLLLLRLGETVAGAACAVLAARFVLPVSTHDESDGKSAVLLRTAARLLKAAPDPGRAPLVDAVRELDRALQAQRQSVGPVTGRGNPASSDRLRAHAKHLSTIAASVRHFYCLATDRDEMAQVDGLRGAVDALAPNLEKVADMLEEPDREARRQPALAAMPALADGGGPAVQVAGEWLGQIDEALRALR